MLSEYKDMRMVLVSPEKDYPEEHGLVQEMFRNGLRTYHVRKPKYNTEKLSEYFSKFDPKYLDKIVTHTHIELSVKFKLKGIHLTERHRKKQKFRTWLTMEYIKFRRPDLQVSTAFHVIQSIMQYSDQYRYVFLNPIFESISKIGYKSTFNEDALKDALGKTKYKVLAMGGVTVDHIERIQNMGFSGFSMLGSIWQAEDPVKEFKKVMEKCEELKIAVS